MAIAQAFLFASVAAAQQAQHPVALAREPVDEVFLESLERKTFLYFWEQASPKTGLIADSSLPGSPSSIASVGFGLTALCIAHSRGWITYKQAHERVLQILHTFKNKLKHEHGFYYHFVDMETGQRAWNSEVSSIDTTLFIAGALFAGEYFPDTEIQKLANELYERVDWQWMMNGQKLMSMGWNPEHGFLKNTWDWYSEGILIYALAIGSPTHPIPSESWFAWRRTKGSYANYEVIHSYFGSLFTYQFAHAWIDFRDLYDGDINYWKNAVNAVLANRHFSVDQQERYKGYGENGWGLTAGEGPDGYKGYGAKPAASLFHDGTINPYGMVASVPLVPYVALPSLHALYETYGDKVYGSYGFKAGFNVDRDWWANHYIGIEQGVSILMIENYRSGMVWDYFMRHAAIQRWITQCMHLALEDRIQETP